MTPEQLAAKVQLAQVRLVYRNYPFTLSANLGVALLLTAALWQHLDHAALLFWFALQFALTARGCWDYLRLRQPLQADDYPAARGQAALQVFALVAIITGLVWGLAALAPLISNSDFAKEVVLLTIIGMAFGGAAFLAVSKKIFYGYLLGMLLPALLCYTLAPGETRFLFTGIVLASIFATLAFAHNVHGLIMHSIQLRFENLDLIEAVSAQRAAADEANLSKSRFLAAASHDLRQPVHALGLFVDALGSHVGSAEGQQILHNVVLSVHTLERMFNDLLDISKLDAGVLTPEMQSFRLASLFERIQAEFAIEARNKGLRLVLRPTDAVVRSDLTLLERVLRNLVGNAINFTQRGGVLLAARKSGDVVRLEVWDSGIGIEPARQSDVFQEFYQVNNPERARSKGVGLGLAIVQRMCRLLQHPLALRSRPGRGSVFTVSLPRGELQTAAPAEVSAAHRPLNPLQGIRVAVVEDDPMVLESMRALLQSWGCVLQLAESGDALLQSMQAQSWTPDVVISDFRLREDENGAEVIRRVQQAAGRAIPSILITGDTAPARLQEAVASGFHLLHKPLRPAKLRGLLAALVAPAAQE